MVDEDTVTFYARAIAACTVLYEPTKTLVGDVFYKIIESATPLCGREERNAFEYSVWSAIKELFGPAENPNGLMKFSDNESGRMRMVLDWCKMQPAGEVRLGIIERFLLMDPGQLVREPVS